MSKGLNDLRDEAHRVAVEHGFNDASIGEDVALIHSEASEALEDHRTGRAPTEVWYEQRTEHREVCQYHETFAGVRHLATVEIRVIEHGEPTLKGPNGPILLKPCGIPSELADVIMRILHFSGKHGIDIEKAVEEKMAYNKSRPFKHGGKTL